MADGNKIYSVSEIFKYINVLMAKDIVLSEVRIKGEITGYSAPASGHIYFSLKEKGKDGWGRPKDYIIKCAKFGHNKDKNCKVEMADGKVVTIIGKVATYESRSEVQVVVSSIFDNNEVGAAKAEYEMRRKRLSAEGLFDDAHKKPIPAFPKSIGIVTSSTGAVRYDIQKEVDKKNPYVKLYLYHALVQGPGAAEQIVKGIEYFDKKTDVDIIIIGRGGGSSEELGPFDEEIVVRAVYNAEKPIIAGTGHEVHFTLADYAADLRASTPTMAASDAVHDVVQDLKDIENLRKGITYSTSQIVKLYRHRIESLELSIKQHNPVQKLKVMEENLKRMVEQLDYNMTRIYENKSNRLTDLSKDLRDNMSRKLESYQNRLDREMARLEAMNPQAKLTGGFGYIEKDGNPVDSVKVVREGDEIRITLHDGEIVAAVKSTK